MAEGGLALYTCDICGQEGLCEEDMRSHVLIEHIENSITCPFCDLEGTTLEEMNWHINAEHLDFLTPTKENDENVGVAMDTDESGQSGTSSADNGMSSHDNDTSTGQESSDGNTQNGKEVIIEGDADEDDNANHNRNQTIDLTNINMDIKVTPILDSPKKKLVKEDSEDASVEEQSRKRAKLFLDVPQASPSKGSLRTHVSQNNRDSVTDNSNSCVNENLQNKVLNITPVKSPNGDDMLWCPICQWSTTSAEEIQRHVNTQHLDVLSPSPKVQSQDGVRKDSENNIISDDPKPSTSTIKFECPICGIHADGATSLELHVNSKHLDVLSPGSGNATPMSIDCSSSEDSPVHTCPICGMEYGDADGLALHVDGHFSAEQTPVADIGVQEDSLLAQELERRERAALKLQEQKEFEKLQALYGMNNKGSYRKQAEQDMERAVCNGQMTISDYYTRKNEIQQANNTGVDDGHSCTKGIILKLKQYYKSAAPFNVRHTWLCSTVDHYAASYGDKGWGCGYRNLQMLLSSLAASSKYEPVLFNGRPLIPSIPKIQRLIEAAWQKGFDVQGSEQLGGKVVNTKKWIGATEIVATMCSLKIKCQLIDFHAPSAKDGTHPRLFEWVRDYFSRDSDFKPPLYLQHQGHSRTIVGIEELKDGSLRLLVFDPSCQKRQMKEFLGNINANLMRCIRRTAHGLKARQYQIVAFTGILSDQEYEESKVLKSERIL